MASPILSSRYPQGIGSQLASDLLANTMHSCPPWPALGPNLNIGAEDEIDVGIQGEALFDAGVEALYDAYKGGDIDPAALLGVLLETDQNTTKRKGSMATAAPSFTSHPLAAPLPPPPPDGDGLTVFHGAYTANTDSSSPEGQGSLTAVQAKRLPLNSGAKAWIPGGAPPNGGGTFQVQYKNAVENVRKALEASEYVDSAEVVEGPTMWHITARVPPQYLPRWRECLLTVAKSALLAAAEESESIYVLGYRLRPFVNTPFGFSCMLGGMLDQSKSCWLAFSKGLCCRGSPCRFEHPVGQMGVDVALKYSSSH